MPAIDARAGVGLVLRNLSENLQKIEGLVTTGRWIVASGILWKRAPAFLALLRDVGHKVGDVLRGNNGPGVPFVARLRAPLLSRGFFLLATRCIERIVRGRAVGVSRVAVRALLESFDTLDEVRDQREQSGTARATWYRKIRSLEILHAEFIGRESIELYGSSGRLECLSQPHPRIPTATKNLRLPAVTYNHVNGYKAPQVGLFQVTLSHDGKTAAVLATYLMDHVLDAADNCLFLVDLASPERPAKRIPPPRD